MTAAAETAMVPVPDAPPAPAPQYARGFDGMAVEPFPEAARRVLAEQIDGRDVEIKPDGIVFLPGVAYRRILTRAFGAGGWAIAPRSAPRYMKESNLVVWHCALFCLGRFVAEAVGECFYRDNNPNMSYASAIEGAKTDAIGRCCKDLGIATEMWDANWRDQWKAKYATSFQGNDGKTRWKLKSRVSNPHDLMVGAGGSSTVAPAATTTPIAATTVTSPPAASAAAGTTADSSASDAGAMRGEKGDNTPDTGEAATDEQKDAIKDQLKRLQWKAGFIKMWFASTFGLVLTDARRAPEALSSQQADTAYFLLQAHGTALYDKVVAEFKGKGAIL